MSRSVMENMEVPHPLFMYKKEIPISYYYGFFLKRTILYLYKYINGSVFCVQK